MMKKIGLSTLVFPVTLVFGLLLSNQEVSGQEVVKSSSTIPEDVNKIVTV